MASTRPPRNPELEGIVIEARRSTAVDSLARREAWEVYADWLLSRGEPVGEWLAASLRADAGGAVAAPVRARLGAIERATRFRLVDLELADLSEVPELERIAEFTWERGFITSAVFRGLEFRAWDSELLGHTPDRFLDVVLRSPSACMLHELELRLPMFSSKGARFGSFAELVAACGEPLALRRLALHGDARGELEARALAFMPALVELELDARGRCGALLANIIRAELLGRLERLHLEVLDATAAKALLAGRSRVSTVDKIELRTHGLRAPLCAALREAGFVVESDASSL